MVYCFTRSSKQITEYFCDSDAFKNTRRLMFVFARGFPLLHLRCSEFDIIEPQHEMFFALSHFYILMYVF